MNQIFKEELFLYFIRPNWGDNSIDRSQAIEVACSAVNVSYDSSYETNGYYSNNRVEAKKSAVNSGSISLSVPLTYQNFDFLFEAQNQDGDISSIVPRIYQAGVLYSGIEFKTLSIAFNEEDVLVANISFVFYDLSHCILRTSAGVENEVNRILGNGVVLGAEDGSVVFSFGVDSNSELIDEFDFELTDEIGDDLIDEGQGPALTIAKDRFTLNEDLLGLVPELDENGNPIADADHEFFDTAPSDSPNVQQLSLITLATSSRLLHTSECAFNLLESNTESAEYSIMDLTIQNLSYSISRNNRAVRSINSILPRKLVKVSHEVSADLSLPLLEEQTQSLFVGAQKYESKFLTLPKFKLAIILKDVDLNTVGSNIYIDGFFESMRSSVNSLGVPQGNLTIIEKIK